MKNWLSRIKKYLKEKNRFIIQNPITFKQKFSIILSKRNTILVLSGFSIVFGLFVFLVISFTSLKNFIPGYPSRGSELFLLDKENQLKLSELSEQNKDRDLWIKNLQSILSNKDSISVSQINESLAKDSNFNYKLIVFERVKEDSILRERIHQIESQGKYSLAKTILKEVLFFEMPLEGNSKELKSNSVSTYSISCKKKESISNTMDGKVIGVSENSLIIQHSHDFVSSFSGIDNLKTELGEFVERGNRLGSTSDTTLLYQLWYKGESVPLRVIEGK